MDRIVPIPLNALYELIFDILDPLGYVSIGDHTSVVFEKGTHRIILEQVELRSSRIRRETIKEIDNS